MMPKEIRVVTFRILNTPFDIFFPFGLFCLLFPHGRNQQERMLLAFGQQLPNFCTVPLGVWGIEKWGYKTSDVHSCSFPTIIFMYCLKKCDPRPLRYLWIERTEGCGSKYKLLFSLFRRTITKIHLPVNVPCLVNDWVISLNNVSRLSLSNSIKQLTRVCLKKIFYPPKKDSIIIPSHLCILHSAIFQFYI